MSVIIEDRVLEYTNSTGTGDLVLAGTISGYRRFVDVCAVNDTFFGAIVAVDSNDAPTGQWETGYYTFTRYGAGTSNDPYVYRIARTFTLSQPTPVNFAAGRKQIFIDFLAYQAKNTGVPTYVSSDIRWFGDARVRGYDGQAANGNLVATPTPAATAAAMPAQPPYVIYNEGVNSNTTAKQLAGTNGQHTLGWQALLATLTNTSIVLLQYGASDAASGLSVADYKSNLTTMVGQARTENKYCILVTPPVTGERDLAPYATAVREVGASATVPVIDFFQYTTNMITGSTPTSLWQLMPDGLHPNQTTYDIKATYASSRFDTMKTGAQTNNKIVFFGDSTTKGWDGAQTSGAEVPRPMPSKFQELQPGYVVTNAGINGATIREHLDGTDPTRPTFAQWLAANNHYYIVLNFGLNDVFTTTVSSFQTDLTTAVDMIKNAGRKPILETPNPADRDLTALVPAIRNVATATGAGLIDHYLNLSNIMTGQAGTSISQLLPDGFHPTQSTYTLLGQYAASQIATFNLPAPRTA